MLKAEKLEQVLKKESKSGTWVEIDPVYLKRIGFVKTFWLLANRCLKFWFGRKPTYRDPLEGHAGLFECDTIPVLEVSGPMGPW